MSGERAEWFLQELGFDLDNAKTDLKNDSYCSKYDTWLRASWTAQNGFALIAERVSGGHEDVNVFDVRGPRRSPLLPEGVSLLLQAVRAAQSGTPQPRPDLGIKEITNIASMSSFSPLKWTELDTRSRRPTADVVFRSTGHVNRDAEMVKLHEGSSTYICDWQGSFHLFSVYWPAKQCGTSTNCSVSTPWPGRAMAKAGGEGKIQVNFDFQAARLSLGRKQGDNTVTWV
ncbi:hypothetical protein CF326_g8521 [Tilletia indica]|nr:hypothetical protein CF326_g8521 [Tilletia indica]